MLVPLRLYDRSDLLLEQLGAPRCSLFLVLNLVRACVGETLAMNENNLKTLSPTRVILRADSNLFAKHNEIIDCWFAFCGLCTDGQPYLWPENGHYVHVGAEGGGRFHVIIDMNKDHISEESMVPLRIWRVHQVEHVEE